MTDQPEPAHIPLEYRNPLKSVPLPPLTTSTAFMFGLACWLIPLAMGVLTFLLWLVCWWEALETAGLCIILFGIVMAVLGGICCMIVLCTRWPRTKKPFRDAIIPALGLALLIASNFVAAGLIVMAVSARSPIVK